MPLLLCTLVLLLAGCIGNVGSGLGPDAGRDTSPSMPEDAAAPALDASVADVDAQVSDAEVPPPVPPFDIVASGRAVDIVVDTADEPAVLRAVDDLQADVERVSGVLPAIKNTTADVTGQVILVGTLGKSPIIDELVSRGVLSVDGIAGKWESFVIRTLDHPLPGVERALVIAGSDRRGTIYGIYDTSELIGVSPWYYWADVTPQHRDVITVPGEPRDHGEPSFKYRGIFLNDEENFVAWAGKLDPGKAPGPETYKKVFELLLRLKANFLWPAMHKISKEFNRYPENVENAERYGVVVGSPDPMMRCNSKEWAPWADAHLVDGALPVFDYTQNPDVIYDYWDARAQEVGARESSYSVGMRGFNEHPSSAKTPRPSRPRSR